MKIYTRKGDDGTTGLLHGSRVRKDDVAPAAYGEVDEAQAFLGLARAETERGSECDELLLGLERDLWVLMAELATAPGRRDTLAPGRTAVSPEMVAALEPLIDDLTGRFRAPTEFVLPGQDRLSALLDVARAVVRRAERRALAAAPPGSHAVAYLNRLSDLLWTMARWQEGEFVPTRERKSS
ncbi:MAG: cob(I)yrinic acid a,c-diamide adenosyltransferase [Acidimicrobiales bacterium]